MKKTLRSSDKRPVDKRSADEMGSEYRFDYRKAKPNRFASQVSPDAFAVVLDPDVAAVFKSSKSVNDLLRSMIQAMPESKRNPPVK